MNVSAVNAQPNVKRNNKLRAAKDGALIVSGVYAVSTGVTWLTNKSEMQNIVKNSGGKGKYAATLVIALGILSAAGAAINTVLYTIMDKIVNNKNSNKTPKAAN